MKKEINSCYINQSNSISPLGETEAEVISSLLEGKNCFSIVNPKNYPEKFPVHLLALLPSTRNLSPADVFNKFEVLKTELISKLFSNLKIKKDIDLVLFSNNSGPNILSYKNDYSML